MKQKGITRVEIEVPRTRRGQKSMHRCEMKFIIMLRITNISVWEGIEGVFRQDGKSGKGREVLGERGRRVR